MTGYGYMHIKKGLVMHIVRQLLIIFCLFSLGIKLAIASDLNLPYGVTPISREIYNLHMAAFYVCCGIGVVVFGILIYSLIKFRKSKGAKAAHFHEHLGLEIFWTAIPFLILVALAIPATIVLKHIHNTQESQLTIKITGYQWKWKYEYLDQGIQFFSNLATTFQQINNQAPKSPFFLLEVDHPMMVPIDTKVKLLVTADDVIHAWWVPELGVKQDAIPGFINENWIYITKPGIYRGQCGELCGVYHGFMPIVVEAVSKSDFEKWVIDNRNAMKQPKNLQPLSENELLNLGKAGYEKSCIMCHQTQGQGLPPTFPALNKSRVATGPVESNIAFVLAGVPGTAMQAFGEQLDDQTLAAIITYTRSSWDNAKLNRIHKNPVIVQPQDIAKVRQSKK